MSISLIPDSGSRFAGEAVAGVRVYLEDGTYAITDSNGYYHFAGIRKGAHVVQMDVQSLPGFYERLPCANDEGHAFAGRPFSQFVDMQGGALWRSDFRGTWHLYGHSHNNLPDKHDSLSFDVGVDANVFYPLSYAEVKERMLRQEWKPPFASAQE